MKRIMIDTNFNWFVPDKPCISLKKVNDNNLQKYNEKYSAKKA